MASVKISYKDLQKNQDSSQLNAVFKPVTHNISINNEMELDKIRDDPKGDFVNLFPFDVDAAEIIANAIKEKGYDKSQFIHVARILEEADTVDNPIRIDGAHRTYAARKAGLEKIPVYFHTFETRNEALIYAYELQLHRRNLEPHQKILALQKLDDLKHPGRKKGDTGENNGKSAEELAQLVQTSTRTAERMRNIINNGTQQQIDDVYNGNKSIHKVDKEINEAKKAKRNEEEIDASTEVTNDCLEDIVIDDDTDVFIDEGVTDDDSDIFIAEDVVSDVEKKSIVTSNFDQMSDQWKIGFAAAIDLVEEEISKGKAISEILAYAKELVNLKSQ